MVLIEIFFFFPPGLRRWQNLFHGKFQFLFPIWKRNRIISLRNNKKKSFRRLLAPHGRPRSPPSPGEPLAPGEWHSTARPRTWRGTDTKPDPEPHNQALPGPPNLLALLPSPA